MSCGSASIRQVRCLCRRGAAALVFFLISNVLASPELPTATPKPRPAASVKQRAKAASGGIARASSLAPASEPIYPSRPIGTAPARRKTKAELEAYRRRLEQDWDKEVARREKGDDKITPQQRRLWQRLDRPWGTLWRSFSAPDEHGYPNN